MRRLLLPVLICTALAASAQNKITDDLQKKFNATALVFYNNTLRMINQTEDKDFDELIRDIEKMKFLLIDKDSLHFSKADYAKLVKEYKAAGYEGMVNARMEGRNFDVCVRQSGSKVKGTIILINDDKNLYVLDVLGSVPMAKVSSLFNLMEGSEVAKHLGKLGKSQKGIVVE
ncbi:MAG: DUF4252 domain-containing protein [Cyclobacteriaceae bacterium]|nr:DUF4252 domain-containing protein [Cyclobacteriaceae bacterium]